METTSSLKTFGVTYVYTYIKKLKKKHKQVQKVDVCIETPQNSIHDFFIN